MAMPAKWSVPGVPRRITSMDSPIKVAGHAVQYAYEWMDFYRGASEKVPLTSFGFSIDPDKCKPFGMMRSHLDYMIEYSTDPRMREKMDILLDKHGKLVKAIKEYVAYDAMSEDDAEATTRRSEALDDAFGEMKAAMTAETLVRADIKRTMEKYFESCRPYSKIAYAMERIATSPPEVAFDLKKEIVEIRDMVSNVHEGGAEWQQATIARINRLHDRLDTFKSRGEYAKNLGDEERKMAKKLWETGSKQVVASQNRVSFEDVYNAPLFRRRLNRLGINSAEEFKNAVQTHNKNEKNRAAAEEETQK